MSQLRAFWWYFLSYFFNDFIHSFTYVRLRVCQSERVKVKGHLAETGSLPSVAFRCQVVGLQQGPLPAEPSLRVSGGVFAV